VVHSWEGSLGGDFCYSNEVHTQLGLKRENRREGSDDGVVIGF
jgi:hypothetical protein